jgi:hypothetical protein
VNQVFSEAGRLRILIELLRCSPDVLRVIARSRRMARAWPWREYERHLDRPLRELREEFEIRVV